MKYAYDEEGIFFYFFLLATLSLLLIPFTLSAFRPAQKLQSACLSTKGVLIWQQNLQKLEHV